MRTSRALAKQIIGAYAGVLFEAAVLTDTVDEVYAQMDAVQRLVRSHAPLRDALLDDSVEPARRSQVARDVFAGLDPALVSTLAVMAERGNFDLLSSMAETYTLVAEEERGMVAVDVTTAVELTDSLRESITTKLAADLGKGVVLREKVDPSIIGGIVLSTHGQRVDASISSQLEAARMVLSTAHHGGEV